jgi:hypothetical protein
MHKFIYDINEEKLNPESKPKPTIQPMDITSESLQRLEKIMSSPRISPFKKDKLIKAITGSCCTCGCVATKMATYKMNGATLIEKYCDACLAREIN